MSAPPLKLLGGPGPPWPPLFLRLCFIAINICNGVGPQVLTTLVTALPLQQGVVGWRDGAV